MGDYLSQEELMVLLGNLIDDEEETKDESVPSHNKIMLDPFMEAVKKVVDIENYNSKDFVDMMLNELDEHKKSVDKSDWTELRWRATNHGFVNVYLSIFEDETMFTRENLLNVYDTIAAEIYQDNQTEFLTNDEFKQYMEKGAGEPDKHYPGKTLYFPWETALYIGDKFGQIKEDLARINKKLTPEQVKQIEQNHSMSLSQTGIVEFDDRKLPGRNATELADLIERHFGITNSDGSNWLSDIETQNSQGALAFIRAEGRRYYSFEEVMEIEKAFNLTGNNTLGYEDRPTAPPKHPNPTPAIGIHISQWQKENPQVKTPKILTREEIDTCIQKFKDGQITTEAFLTQIHDARDSNGMPRVSSLQTQFAIGYNFACRLVEGNYTQDDIDVIEKQVTRTIIRLTKKTINQEFTFKGGQMERAYPDEFIATLTNYSDNYEFTQAELDELLNDWELNNENNNDHTSDPLPPQDPSNTQTHTKPQPKPFMPIPPKPKHKKPITDKQILGFKKQLLQMAFYYDVIASYYETSIQQSTGKDKNIYKKEQDLFMKSGVKIANIVEEIDGGLDADGITDKINDLEMYHELAISNMQTDYGKNWFDININRDYTMKIVGVVKQGEPTAQTEAERKMEEKANKKAWAEYYAGYLGGDITRGYRVVELVEKVNLVPIAGDEDRFKQYDLDKAELSDLFAEMGEKSCEKFLQWEQIKEREKTSGKGDSIDNSDEQEI